MTSCFCCNPDCRFHRPHWDRKIIEGKIDHREGIVSKYVVDRELAWGFNGRSYFCCSECLPLFKRFGHALKKICDDPELQKEYGIDIFDPDFDAIDWLLKQWKREQNHTRAFTWTDDLGRKRRFINAPISQDFRQKSPGRWSNLYRGNNVTSDVLLDPDQTSGLSQELLENLRQGLDAREELLSNARKQALQDYSRFQREYMNVWRQDQEHPSWFTQVMRDLAAQNEASGISAVNRGVEPRRSPLLEFFNHGLISRDTALDRLGFQSDSRSYKTATEIMAEQRLNDRRIQFLQRQEEAYRQGARQVQNDMVNALRYSFSLPEDSGVNFIPLRASKSEVAARHRKTIVGDDAEADEIGDFLSLEKGDSE